MFRRARISLSFAIIAGLPAFAGIIHEWEAASRIVFGICLGFSVISFMLGMFEEEPPRAVSVRQTNRKSFEFREMEPVRVAP